MLKFALGSVLSLVIAGAANAAVSVSIEAPGVQTTTVALTNSRVETFDSFSGGYHFGLAAADGTYAGDTFAYGADSYGGAGGAGKYLTVNGAVTLTVAGGPVDYFGLWASALDGGNSVAFYKGGALIDTVSLVDYPLSSAYFGNPNNGADGGEKFAFFNFTVDGGYDQVALIQNGGGGFESDNHTIGDIAVPEPATWALMIGGFGMVGQMLRRRRRLAATA